MAAVGSLLDHSGPIGESEKYAARVFGAHRSYTVTNGTSGSNRIIFMASLTQNDIALCDRNCHKSIEHGLVMTGAIPVFLVPHRNRYGIIGPIYPEDLQPETVRKRASANPLTASANRFKPQHTIITNSTYDGLIYNVERVIEIGGDVIDRLHFDEAWYAYARFNPLYRGRYAMFGDPAAYKNGPTVFATHSTHKLLAALSQASFIPYGQKIEPVEKRGIVSAGVALPGGLGYVFWGRPIADRLAWRTNELGAHPGLRHGDGGPGAAAAEQISSCRKPYPEGQVEGAGEVLGRRASTHGRTRQHDEYQKGRHP
jgi:arginine/lysine/ornithine decarboxylase